MGALAQRIFVQLLADRDGQLQACLLRPGQGDPAALTAAEAWSELTGRLPCLVLASEAGQFGDAATALNAAGCTTVDDALIGRPEHAEALATLAADVGHVAGDWYLQPLQRPLKDQTGSRALALKLLELVVADAETRDIEDIFRREPTLSYHLLRLVNSPSIGAGRRIDSFAQAIMVLGRRQLRRWLNLLLFTARKDDPRAPMLLARVSLRARLLEQLARVAGEDRDGQERAFMVGMFSLLGVTFALPLEEVLQPLNLDDQVVAALLRREGVLGALLAGVEACEQGDGERVQALLGALLPQDTEIDVLAIEACLWMVSLLGGGDRG